MTTSTLTPYRSARKPGRDGFPQVLWSEWTKFRTVRGWILALIAAPLLAALATIAITGAANGTQNPGAQNPGPVGPNGEAVTDQFEFAHQPLAGNGSITVAVTSLTGSVVSQPGGLPPGLLRQVGPGPQPWTKAGIIIKDGTRPGSAYAAVMVTGTHGVRMQYDYTHDIAGQGGSPSAAKPAWLRLTRSGDTITGYDSADGTHWTAIGTATLTGLPSTVQAGMFATSPTAMLTTQGLASNNGVLVPTLGTATFGHVSRTGDWPAGAWTPTEVGQGQPSGAPSAPRGQCSQVCTRAGKGAATGAAVTAHGAIYTVTGSGDIAPYVPVLDPLGLSFKGTLVGLIAVIALGALFITTEFRRGMMIRTTFVASPSRGRVLAAKALVIGSVTFVAGLAGAAVALVVGGHKLVQSGWSAAVFPAWPLLSAHGLQIVVGTAGLFGLAAVLAVAAGAALRRSAGAIAAVIGVIIVPLILATLLPMGPAQWLLRLTPAAAFAVQQGTASYPQVTHACLPYNGCYPLSPWHGFAVLVIWAALALGAAILVLRRRDA
jgi:ABC-type transport system involved in multi-copper enzyme maturation permease subunit